MVKDRPWDASISYEIDDKEGKFLCHQDSVVFKTGPADSKWRFKVEGTRRKNRLDYYASREFIENELLHTYKQTFGLEYGDLSENSFKKLDLELALPPGLGSNKGQPSFIRVDGLIAKSIELIAGKIKLSFQLSGGLVRPILGS